MNINTCWLGLHDWETVRYVKYKDDISERLAFPEHRTRRVCKDCGKTQEKEVHLISENEGGKYQSIWVDVPKVECDNKGKVEIIVDGAGCLLVHDKKLNRCYSVAIHEYLGPIESQGDCSKLGKYAIAYQNE